MLHQLLVYINYSIKNNNNNYLSLKKMVSHSPSAVFLLGCDWLPRFELAWSPSGGHYLHELTQAALAGAHYNYRRMLGLGSLSYI